MTRNSTYSPTIVAAGNEPIKNAPYEGILVSFNDEKGEGRIDMGGKNIAAFRLERVVRITAEGNKPWFTDDFDSEVPMLVGTKLICLLGLNAQRQLVVYKATSKERFNAALIEIHDRKVKEWTGDLITGNEIYHGVLRRGIVIALPAQGLPGLVQMTNTSDPKEAIKASYYKKALVTVTCNDGRLWLTDEHRDTMLSIGQQVRCLLETDENNHAIVTKMCLADEADEARREWEKPAAPLTSYHYDPKGERSHKPQPKPEPKPVITIVPDKLKVYIPDADTGTQG